MTSQGSALTVAVYHRSADVEQHVAALRRSRRVRIAVERQGSTWTPPREASGILWELSAENGLDRRRVSALIDHAPVASYGATRDRQIADLSRTLGFRHHLAAPLRLPEVERALGLPGVVDLADRIDAVTPRLLKLAGRTDLVGDLLRSVNVSTDPSAVASALVSRAADWLPLAAWSVVAVEPDGGVRWLAGQDADIALKSPAEAIADAVVQSGEPYVIDRVAGDTRIGEFVEAAALGWPLVANGVLVGVLVGVDHGRSRRTPSLAPAFKSALALLVEPAGFALAHALRVVRAEALSVTDDLTQLYNSRYLHDVLRKETKRATRSGRPLSLLFVDLDGFKRINDAHGHLLGSRAIIEAAAVIRSSARETDIVARFGGDEFAIVLPDTGPEAARAVARRLRERIGRYVFLADRGPGSRLTASVGVATLPEAADSAEGLLQAADAAMYRVKDMGKDGISIAGQGVDVANLDEGDRGVSETEREGGKPDPGPRNTKESS
jgi:diguanylate cyclase (GGDEF)-like protein